MRRAAIIILSCLAAVAWAGSARRLVMISARVPRDDMVAWWRPAISGATNDYWSTNTAHCLNGAETVQGSGFHFDGEDDWASCGTGICVRIQTAMTMAAWCKTREARLNRMIVSEAAHAFYCGRFTAGKFLVFFDGSSGNNNSGDESTTSINDGKWHHVVGANDGTTTRIYVDGIEENNYNETLSALTNRNFAIGSQFDGGASFCFTGTVDEVVVWSRVLSSNEIYQLYMYGKRSHMD